jgi:hypothetical protein
MRVLLAGLALALVGCILPSPDYDGTAFSCAEEPFSCPSGQRCEQGVCVGEPIAEPDGPDAATPVDDEADAAPVSDPPADAGEVGEPLTVTLGDRPNADIKNVTRDSYIRQTDPTDNFGDDDVVDADVDPLTRGLLRFDTAAIPSSAQVLAAELEIYVSNGIEDGDLRIHELLEDWSENQVTWRDRRANQRWTAAGAGPGSHGAGVLATLVARDIGSYIVTLPPSIVQQWVSAPSTNYGVLWVSSSPTDRGAQFESRDSNEDDQRPLLRITYR